MHLYQCVNLYLFTSASLFSETPFLDCLTKQDSSYIRKDGASDHSKSPLLIYLPPSFQKKRRKKKQNPTKTTTNKNSCSTESKLENSSALDKTAVLWVSVNNLRIIFREDATLLLPQVFRLRL